MKPVPVLHVLPHSPWYFRDPSLPMDESAMTDDWHVRTARALEHAFPGRFALECWRPDWREPKAKTAVAGGIACRIFPSRPAPLGKFSYELSLPLLKALWRKARRERFILHLHEMHSALGLATALLPAGALKTAHTHGTPPVGLRLAEGRPFAKRLALTALLPFENASLKRYRHLFAISDRELDYLRFHRLPCSKLTMGADFSTFVPRDKRRARQALNLPQDARIVLYLGRFFRLKGLDRLLDAMPRVRSVLPGAYMVAAGGLPQDDLFDETVARADKALPRVPHADLPDLIAASDLCIPNVADPGLLGIGMATVEALAMNVPVLTSALGEFPGTPAQRDALGVLHRPGQDDLAASILEGFSRPREASPRETARSFYDWGVIAAGIADVYDRVWREE